MNVLTVSRQYGAGGGEVARRLAERLDWELLDRELLHQAAAIENVPDGELESLDEKALSLADRWRRHPPHERYMRGLQQAAQEAATRGNVVLVGRGSRFLVGDAPGVFRLRLVAPLAWRAERMAHLQGWSTEEALARCAEVDHSRERFMRYFYGEAAIVPATYDLVVNTARVPLDDLIQVIAEFLRGETPAETSPSPARRRVVTVSREMAAGDATLAASMAGRLGLRFYDRDFLEEEARRLGVTQEELQRLEEQPAAKPRSGAGQLQQRYFEVLRLLFRELAGQGNVLLVGRGGSGFLQDDADVFHARLTAPMTCRVRRVMEHHWLKEEPARKLVAESDEKRRRFYQNLFGRDWASPLEYHATVNAGRLAGNAVELIALMVQQHWRRRTEGAD